MSFDMYRTVYNLDSLLLFKLWAPSLIGKCNKRKSVFDESVS